MTATAIARGTLKTGIGRLTIAMEADAEMLNAADGQLGDGDLGVTMVRGMRLVSEKADDLPDDVGMALMACAQAFTKTSGSSYGTLLATGLMNMAKATKGRTDVPWPELGDLVGGARDAMMQRGKASLGDKTVLDALDAIASAIAGKDDPAAIGEAAVEAVQTTLDRFRGKEAKIGRARIFAERSVGLDDPGMLAMQRVVLAFAGKHPAQ
ncbi:dihydroxyacetone kinase subunit L [Fodinicurvata sp. EGI_FJ10296]|uniref:dihydroxyacetone kinase subunit L n=1 Tax=Fodinicurvata sp. EGI_FJ10296 TaxID=3231908 RepID=UPI0034522768